MEDRNGNNIKIGDRVLVKHDDFTESGGPGFVRDIRTDRRGAKARVDDGPADLADGEWTWSAWARPNDVELVATDRTGEKGR
jgi:hypothetical protein